MSAVLLGVGEPVSAFFQLWLIMSVGLLRSDACRYFSISAAASAVELFLGLVFGW